MATASHTAVGLVRLHAGAADLWSQQAARCKGIVANQFAIQPESGPAAEKPVLRILLCF